MPANMIKNPYMDSVVNGIPEGYAASGLTIAAAHPYTKGFEGTYTETIPTNATNDTALANRENPFWYGRYNKGPRFPVWGGGLRDGWGGLGGGNILQMTGVPGEDPNASRQVFMPVSRRTYTARVGFRAWVYLAKGSRMRIGDHAGYQGRHGSRVILKSEFDNARNGWVFVDIVAGVNAGMAVRSNIFSIGFDNNEEIEAYMAMPYLYTFLHQPALGVPMGE